MKILLIKPYSLPGETNITPAVRDEKYHILLEPLELEILAAAVPEHEVKILDLRAEDDKDYLKAVGAFKPDIVGMTCYTVGVYITKKILRTIKEKHHNILTVVGGHHATLIPGDFYEPYIDMVVIGEGEHTFAEIAGRYSSGADLGPIKGTAYNDKGNFVKNELRELTDLETLPPPRRDLTGRYRGKYHLFRIPAAIMELSRGCKHRCNFCSVWKCARGTFRSRRADSAVEELKNIREKMVFIVDPNPFYDPGTVQEFIDGIRRHKIKKEYMLECSAENVVKHEGLFKEWAGLGLKLVLVGVESIRVKDLTDFRKGISADVNDRSIDILKKYKILPYAHFVISPGLDYKDFADLKTYLDKKEIAVPAFGTLAPLPGSDLYNEVKEDLIADNYEMFDFFYSLLPTALRAREFYRQLYLLYRFSYGLKRQMGFWLKKVCTLGLGRTQSLSLGTILNMHKILAAYKPPKRKKRK
jgi:radical SAM superfamily enzyme YgiQ (UPF0313 family)